MRAVEFHRRFKQGLLEFKTGKIEFCELAITKERNGVGLVLSLIAPGEDLLQAISSYPIESLTISGGQLRLACLKGMDVHELDLVAVECHGPEDVIINLPLRRFRAHYMAWTNLPVLSQIGTLTDVKVAVSKTASPIEIVPLTRLQKLQRLELLGSWGSDVAGLSELPLRHLGLIDNSCINGLSALKNLHLTSLDLSGSAVSNISFVAGMRLESLNLSGTRVTDIGVLRGMPIKALRMDGVAIYDLTPLEGMPLEYLVFDPLAARKGLDYIRAMSSSLILIGTRGDGRSVDTDVTAPNEFWRRFDSLGGSRPKRVNND